MFVTHVTYVCQCATQTLVMLICLMVVESASIHLILRLQDTNPRSDFCQSSLSGQMVLDGPWAFS